MSSFSNELVHSGKTHHLSAVAGAFDRLPDDGKSVVHAEAHVLDDPDLAQVLLQSELFRQPVG